MTDSVTAQPLGSLMVDVAGTELRADERDFLRHPAVGAVILFARNCESRAQVTALTTEIKALRSPSLLIAVDQEGGRVQRLSPDAGFRALPALARIGEIHRRDAQCAIGAVELARAAGFVMASEVIAVGIDFSFAPVLDCAHPRSEVIGDRAFDRDPQVVSELAGAYIAGMDDAGMAATGKHFPGHGGVAADSHAQLPVDARAMDELAQRDLIPFQRLAPHLRAMMTAHIRFARIDADLPAYSSFWLREVLRRRLRFDGVIFSDDLNMQGAADRPVSERAIAALSAGCDMALLCNDPHNARAAADALLRESPEAAIGSKRLETMRAKPQAQDSDATAHAAEMLDAALA